MPDAKGSVKRAAISKSNAQVVLIVSIASFVSVFCLVASQALWSQNMYLSKVISAKQKAHVQLKNNIKAAGVLSDSYGKFTSADPNIIGGSLKGAGDKDGDNAKIILDALPSSYDFPALASSLEKILSGKSLKVSSINGTDDQLAQQNAGATPIPQPVPMAFTFTVGDASYASVQDLIKTLQSSIRPIQIDSFTLGGDVSSMTLTVAAHTYYQPPKAVNITNEVIK